MDDLAVGRLLRLARSRRRLRQAVVARIAGVHQGTVSLAERGQVGALTIRTTRAIAAALEIGLQFEPRSRGPALDRLRDAGHAAAVEAVAAELARHGWDVLIEVGFSRYGERGSVDVIGWRATECALLIVEVKTSLVDLQATLGAIDRKRRIVPGELSRERGWRPTAIGVALVVVDSSTARDVVTPPSIDLRLRVSKPDRRDASLAGEPDRRPSRPVVSPIYAQGSYYGTNRVVASAPGRFAGPAAPLLSTTRAAQPRDATPAARGPT